MVLSAELSITYALISLSLRHGQYAYYTVIDQYYITYNWVYIYFLFWWGKRYLLKPTPHYNEHTYFNFKLNTAMIFKILLLWWGMRYIYNFKFKFPSLFFSRLIDGEVLNFIYVSSLYPSCYFKKGRIQKYFMCSVLAILF